jgi:CDP-diacylglycerol--serine O-phosphatidyltransferase
VLANAVTCGNLACGVAAILRREEGHPVRRSALILAGLFCDSLDGTIARRSGNATVPGAAADAISDIVTFGIAPVVLLETWPPTHRTRLARIAPGCYLAAIAWRTWRYGIKPRTSHVFLGLPMGGAGLIFAVACQARLPRWAMDYLTVALSAAMFSRVRVLSVEALIRPNLSLDIPAGAPRRARDRKSAKSRLCARRRRSPRG